MNTDDYFDFSGFGQDQVYRYRGDELQINPRFMSARRRQSLGYPAQREEAERSVSRMAGDKIKENFGGNENSDEKSPSMEELMSAGLRSVNEKDWKGRMGKEDYNTPAKLFNELPESFSAKRPGE